MKTRRLAEMEAYIRARGSATMQELCDEFRVSMNTARRDVAELQKTAGLEKVYGGVRSTASPQALVPYAVRAHTAEARKKSIGQEAARLVRDGDIVFVDSGTTTMHVMDALRERRITVITNNIEVLSRAMPCENIRLIVLPGEVRRSTNSITGEESAEFLSRFNTNIAFLAATGVSVAGVTNSSPAEYAIKKAAVAHTERAVLLVSSGKFGVTSLLSYAEVSRLSAVVTDRGISDEYREFLRLQGTELIVAGEGRHGKSSS